MWRSSGVSFDQLSPSVRNSSKFIEMPLLNSAGLTLDTYEAVTYGYKIGDQAFTDSLL